jgi:hypothetical protein
MRRFILITLFVTAGCTVSSSTTSTDAGSTTAPSTTVTTTTTIAATTTTTSTTTTSTTAPPVPTVSTQTRSDESATFELVVNSPIVGNVDYATRINEQTAQAIGRVVDGFLIQAARTQVEEVAGPHQLYVSYRTGTVGPTLVSLEIDISTYISGAAHPFDTVTTLTFIDGDQISVSDHITNSGEVTDAIAASIAHQFGDAPADVIDAAGGADQLLSLAHFVVTEGGLVALFDQYSVAPGAAGIVRVVLPFDQLALSGWPS